MSNDCAVPMITYATIGTKWQIVIPKEAREQLHVNSWDRVVLIIDHGKMMVINPDGIQQMIQILQEGMGQPIEWVATQLSKKTTKRSTKK